MTYDELADQLRYPDDPAMQELYVQTFDLSPACTLEVGWHLFGENYERGEFLVKAREELRRHGIAESTELPDHLTHLLRLIARMQHDEAAQLAGQYLLPALAKVGEASWPVQSPYPAVLGEIERKLRTDFPDAPRRPVSLPIFQEAACD